MNLQLVVSLAVLAWFFGMFAASITLILIIDKWPSRCGWLDGAWGNATVLAWPVALCVVAVVAPAWVDRKFSRTVDRLVYGIVRAEYNIKGIT